MAPNEYTPDEISPPGDTLAETLDAMGMKQAELAKRTGRPLKTINEIIQGKAAITAETALQLERVLGVPAAFWANREAQYRQSLARMARRGEAAKYVHRLREVPYAAMQRLGWVPRVSDPIDKLENILSFFGAASFTVLESIAADARFRKSKAFAADPVAIGAWLRRGHIEAAAIECAPYDEACFRRALATARAMTATLPCDFTQRLVKSCAVAGVALVFIPELPRCRASGATRWLTPEKPMIQLSLRYKTDDHFWFTFFHEAAHVLKQHSKREVIIEEAASKEDEREREADGFASDFLIPPAELKRLDGVRLSAAVVKRFAASIRVSPGIVVGRLHHEGMLPYAHLNGLKRRVTISRA